MRTTFSAARHHLEQACQLLPGDDELSTKSRQALTILIDAFLAADYSDTKGASDVVDLAEHRRRRSGRH